MASRKADNGAWLLVESSVVHVQDVGTIDKGEELQQHAAEVVLIKIGQMT